MPIVALVVVTSTDTLSSGSAAVNGSEATQLHSIIPTQRMTSDLLPP